MPSRFTKILTKGTINKDRDLQRLLKGENLHIYDTTPRNNEGQNGEIRIVKIGDIEPHLFFKVNNRWYSTLSVDINKDGDVNVRDIIDAISSPIHTNSMEYDTGWFGANDSIDSNVLQSNPGTYLIDHNLGSELVTSNVFCRFEGLRDGANNLYIIDLKSHISNSGPNASRYGYWINMKNKNQVELNIHPDGLSILHSDMLKDTSDNTSTLISSNDTDNVGAVELRVFINGVRKNGTSINSHARTRVSESVSFKDSVGLRASTGKAAVNNLGAAVDGTKNSGFSIDSDGTGVLLKNDSGTLKVRNLADTDDLTIQAKTIALVRGAASGEDKIFDIHYDDNAKTRFTVNSAGHLQIANYDSGGGLAGTTKISGAQLAFDGLNTNYILMGDAESNNNGNDLSISSGAGDNGGAATADRTGGDLIILGGQGTGTGDGGDILFKVAIPSGSTSNTLNSANDNAIRIHGDDAHVEIFENLVLSSTSGEETTFSVADTSGILTIATTASTATDADIVLDAGGEIKLETSSKISLETADGEANAVSITTEDSDEIAFSFDMEHENNTQFTMNEQGGKSTDDYFRINVGEEADTIISTLDASGTDADLTLDIDGDITLDSATGAFIAKKAGTQFSVANSAYAGMILGYRCLGHNAGRVSYTITTGFVTLHANATVRFIAPPSGVVEVYVQAGYLDAVASRFIYFGLSDNATYNTIGAEHEEVVNLTDESDQRVIQNKWVISGLTAGNTYNYWFGIKSSHPSSVLNYGGTGSGHYPPFIMSVTALPTAVSDFAEYA